MATEQDFERALIAAGFTRRADDGLWARDNRQGQYPGSPKQWQVTRNAANACDDWHIMVNP